MSPPAKSFFVRSIKRILSLQFQARVVTALFPASMWYSAADFISYLHGGLAKLLRRNGALTRALMLDYWLTELTRVGPFPIAWRVADASAFEHFTPGQGILFSWTHVPLVELAMSQLVVFDQKPLIVCDPGMMVEKNKFLVLGHAIRGPAVPAQPSSLRRALTELRNGRSVMWLADPYFGGQISDQTLRLVELSGARLIFVWGERDADGTIALRFIDPPFPLCENAAAIQANLEVLRNERRRIMAGLGVSETGSSIETSAAETAVQ